MFALVDLPGGLASCSIGLTRSGRNRVPTELGKRYICTVCNTEVIVTRKGTGDLTCCGKPMELKR
ncbi:MAG: hypothetical protein NZ773_12075 [Dehalococcoidia bacterium]|nr:hypothetical protein [Dehalococcoidia bacterium]